MLGFDVRRALMTRDLLFGFTDARPGGALVGTTRLTLVVLGRWETGARLGRTAGNWRTQAARGGALGRRGQLIGAERGCRSRGTASDTGRTAGTGRTREPLGRLQQLHQVLLHIFRHEVGISDPCWSYHLQGMNFIENLSLVFNVLCLFSWSSWPRAILSVRVWVRLVRAQKWQLGSSFKFFSFWSPPPPDCVQDKRRLSRESTNSKLWGEQLQSVPPPPPKCPTLVGLNI